MLLTSDGRAFVYGVFTCDGAECADFHSLHVTQELADACAEQLRNDPEWFGSPCARYGRCGFVEVQSLELHGQVQRPGGTA